MSVDILKTDGTIVGMIRAAYRSTAKRVVLLGEGEEVTPDFQETYDAVIGPCLDKRDAGFALWPLASDRTNGNQVHPSQTVINTVMVEGTIPSVFANGVFNRFTAIRALKEAQDTLITNPSLELPGKRIGSDLLLLKRHCDHFARWLYVDKVLTQGLKRQSVSRDALGMAYEAARDQAACPPTYLSPRLILAYSAYEPKDEAAKNRQAAARMSWGFHAHNAGLVECPFASAEIPTLTQLLDHAARFALPEDIICYANSDAGFTTLFCDAVSRGVSKGNGVTVCAKREVQCGGFFASLLDNKMPGGIEAVAMTPAWWKAHRDKMPAMFIGREAWDAVFMHLAEEWADGHALDGICQTHLYRLSKGHTDNVCWHVEHPSYWAQNRHDMHNVLNRDFARQFFAARDKKTIWNEIP